MTADAAGVSERELLIRAIHAATFYDEDGPFGVHALNDEAEGMVADAILADGFGDVAQVKAERDAALADLRDAQRLLHILAGRPGGLFVTSAEIVAYSDGGTLRITPEVDGVRIESTSKATP